MLGDTAAGIVAGIASFFGQVESWNNNCPVIQFVSTRQPSATRVGRPVLPCAHPLALSLTREARVELRQLFVAARTSH